MQGEKLSIKLIIKVIHIKNNILLIFNKDDTEYDY